MTPFFWFGVVVLLVSIGFASILIGELKSLRATVAQLLASVAESNWRIRDELAPISKRRESGD
jgi:hypothetical protein